MSTSPRLLARVRVQLSTTAAAANPQAADFRDLSSLMSPAGITAIFGRVVLTEVNGPFNAQLAIQTYIGDPEVMSTPVTPQSGLNLGPYTAVGKSPIRFDPTGATNGDITVKGGFRLGMSYWSGTAGTLARGEVIVELWANG